MISAAASSKISLPTENLSTAERKAAQRDRIRLQQARSAMEALKASRPKNGRASGADSRKAAAKEKIEQLKRLLKMMQMGSAPNSKAIAQIARELKAAIKAYGSAGGSTAGLEPSTPVESASGESGAVEADAATAEATTPTAEAAVPVSVPVAADKTTEDGDNEEAADGDTRPEERADAPRSGQADPYRRMAEAALARGKEDARDHAAKEADREFISDVRALAAALKSLAKRAAQQAKNEPGAQVSADEASKAVAEVDEAIADAASNLGAGGVSITA